MGLVIAAIGKLWLSLATIYRAPAHRPHSIVFFESWADKATIWRMMQQEKSNNEMRHVNAAHVRLELYLPAVSVPTSK